MFLCDEGSPVIRVLVPTAGSNSSARIVDRFAFKYYGKVLNLLNVYRSKHIHEPAHLNYACTITGGSMRKRRASYKKQIGISDLEGSHNSKPKYTISGCRTQWATGLSLAKNDVHISFFPLVNRLA